jgi:hypothetical protein
MQESILAGLMEDRRAWEAATEPQRRLAMAADAELRRRNPEMRIEPLRSAEPEEVTGEQRAELDVLPEEQHEYQPPAWVRELAEARKALSEKIAERQSVMEPHEDADYADVGQEIFHQVADLLNLEVDLLFSGTTSTYFELDGEDEPLPRDKNGNVTDDAQKAVEGKPTPFRACGKSHAGKLAGARGV